MIGSCDCCDRQDVPVSHFSATAAYPEGCACFICQGETDPDPYGELESSRNVSGNENGKNFPEKGNFFPKTGTEGDSSFPSHQSGIPQP